MHRHWVQSECMRGTDEGERNETVMIKVVLDQVTWEIASEYVCFSY